MNLCMPSINYLYPNFLDTMTLLLKQPSLIHHHNLFRANNTIKEKLLQSGHFLPNPSNITTNMNKKRYLTQT